MITLEEAKVGMADKVDQQVVDEFRRNSMLMDTMEWDDAVSPHRRQYAGLWLHAAGDSVCGRNQIA